MSASAPQNQGRIGGCATPQGTLRYAARFQGHSAAGHFREIPGGLVLSSIGIGTYLGEPDAATDKAYADAIVAAVEGGVNVIDSAINYRFQRSERSVGAALKELVAKGFSRDELVLCTKAGFLTPNGEMPADPNTYFAHEFLDRGIFRPEEIAAGCHCMSPKYLADQLERSLGNFGADCIDVFYLHNPETQLTEVSAPEFQKRIRDAFTFLESADRQRKNRRVRHGHLERLPRRSQVPRLPFIRRDGCNRARRGRRGASLSICAVAVQPSDAGSPNAAESDDRRESDADGAGGSRPGSKSRHKRGAFAGPTHEESPAVRSLRPKSEERIRARIAIRAFRSWTHHSARRHEPRRTCSREPHTGRSGACRPRTIPEIVRVEGLSTVGTFDLQRKTHGSLESSSAMLTGWRSSTHAPSAAVIWSSIPVKK